ncbi:hypothetical protein AB1Y20_010119 [Prymnesium parvum]|uniref:Uncharacterized protein n=1 Tax=Prymnesium parvum TaxID=97485 RepID=A0AB34K335_PRYPA
MKKLNISETATADEVDDAFRTIEINWPKIIGYDNSSAAPSIEFAISLFPRAYMHRAYIAALQIYHDGGGRWTKFSDFRAEVVERLKCCDARDPPPVQPAAFAAVPESATRKKTTHAQSACQRCDMSFCDGKDCIIFNTNAPVRASGSARRLVHYLRQYAKEKNLKSMKGERPPDAWFRQQRDAAKKKKAEKSVEKAAHPVVPNDDDEDGMDNAFWETLDSAGSPSVFVAAHFEGGMSDSDDTESIDTAPEPSHRHSAVDFRSPIPRMNSPIPRMNSIDRNAARRETTSGGYVFVRVTGI